MKKEVEMNNCVKCEYKWEQRKKEGKPKSCPKCKSYDWEKKE